MTPTTIPSPQFVMKPCRWNCTPSLVVGMPPLSGHLLSLLPKQRSTFTTALQKGCVTHWWQASATAPQIVVPPSPPLPLLLSSLDSRHHPTVAPQPPTVTVVCWHTFITLRCLLLASIVLCHILPYLLVCRHGFDICRSPVTTSSNNALPLPHSCCSSTTVSRLNGVPR